METNKQLSEYFKKNCLIAVEDTDELSVNRGQVGYENDKAKATIYFPCDDPEGQPEEENPEDFIVLYESEKFVDYFYTRDKAEAAKRMNQFVGFWGEREFSKAEALKIILGAATSYLENLETGLEDGTYQEGVMTQKTLRPAISLFEQYLDENPIQPPTDLKLFLVFGNQAVRIFEDKEGERLTPNEIRQIQNNGAVLSETFKTEAERQAFMKGLNSGNGWDNYALLDPDEYNQLAQEPAEKPIKVCSECGSKNVMLDAWAKQDPETGEFDDVMTFDAAYCGSCDTGTKLINESEFNS